jgi:hypothetical protein
MKVLPAPESCVFFVELQAVRERNTAATAMEAFVLCLTFEDLLVVRDTANAYSRSRARE